ncbi:potassium channel family protein [Mycobacterium deserti]|uniref:Potassium channel family protein n=1 Tax=Mycobacterium deserti TaxID=2978347 RepID=A0ABT2M9M3_9MYCO|nr:potassium channel family protein [Mycobacterium deserti]MCT7658969.1 potassium channel family protein [Mycobacterium deserti]
MDWVITAVGVALVLVVVRDVFHTLFHPIGHGSIAPQVMRGTWRLLRLFPKDRRITSLTGPLGIVAVIGTWAAGAVLGWALIYLAQMPGGVVYGSELDGIPRNEFFDSLYLSLVTIATLGFGEIVPVSPWLRLAAPLEALFGFLLVTAAVSWVLQIYPALHRRRVLALELTTLREARSADPRLGVDDIPTDVLTALTASVAETRNDFTQYGATYYFRDMEADSSLAASLEYAIDLGAEASRSERPETRVAAAMLTAAVDRLAKLLDEEFLHLGGDTAAIINAYADDHGHGPGSAD